MANFRALTVMQPWASAIAEWPKRIENRTWSPPKELFGQLLAIHAGKIIDGEGLQACEDLGFRRNWSDLPTGAIIAVATVKGVVTTSDDPWFARGKYGWVLDDVVAIPPIPCRGFQRLWWCDGKTAATVIARYEERKAAVRA